MSSSTGTEDERRRRSPLLVLLLAAGLLVGIVVGQLLPAGEASGTAAPRRTPGTTVVQPTSEPVAAPSPAPAVVVTGSGQSSGLGASGTARTASGVRLDVTSVVVGQVSPGRPAVLRLTFRSSGLRGVVVTAASAAVTSVVGSGRGDLPACSPAWFALEPLPSALPVPAGDAREVDLVLTFLDSPTVNQDDCKGARFSYSFTARARQA